MGNYFWKKKKKKHIVLVLSWRRHIPDQHNMLVLSWRRHIPDHEHPPAVGAHLTQPDIIHIHEYRRTQNVPDDIAMSRVVYELYDFPMNIKRITMRAKSKSLDRLSLYGCIHPFTAQMIFLFLSIVRWNYHKHFVSVEFPLPTTCLNVAFNSGVRVSIVWINIETGERDKYLISTLKWFNTFGPDCRFTYCDLSSLLLCTIG